MASKGIALVTGCNGFIAARVVQTLLEAGYDVRGTVRKLTSGDALKSVLAEYGNRLEIISVPDITVDGAFDEAVKGVSAICHMASPVSMSFTDASIIDIAVKGTISILNSAVKYAGPQLKSVVYTSSIAAVWQPHEPPHTYTEADVNTWAPSFAATLVKDGKDVPGPLIYVASKAKAEAEFWAWKEREKPSFGMTAINPGFVGGPPLVLPSDPSQISETVISVYKILAGHPIPPALSPSSSFIDNRDVARMMTWAASNPDLANGERYICIAAAPNEQAVADVLNKHYPERNLEKGTPGEGYVEGYGYAEGGLKVDASKAVKATGVEWIGFEKGVLDAAKAFERYL